MKPYRKFLAYACIGVLALSSLYGCKKKAPETESQAQTETQVQKETQAPTEAPTEQETKQSETPASEPQTEAETRQSEPAPETSGETAQAPESVSTEEPGNDSGVSGTDTGEAVDIYRNDGTYTRLTKDANGHWADANGITYELREDGAMDSNGEFHPW